MTEHATPSELMGWLCRESARHALLVVVAAAVLTGVCAGYLGHSFRIDTDDHNMLSADLPFRRDARALSAAFPRLSDGLVVMVEGDTPDVAADAAGALAADLAQARPGVFSSVYYPAGLPFVRAHALLFLDPDELAELSDRLAPAQPFLAVLWRDPTLGGLARIVEVAADEAGTRESTLFTKLATSLRLIADRTEGFLDGSRVPLSWRRLITGEAPTPRSKLRVILLNPVLATSTLNPAAVAIDTVRERAAALGLTPSSGVRVRITGTAAIAQQELANVRNGLGLAGILSVALVTAVLGAGLRSLAAVAAVLVTLGCGLVLTAGFAIATIGFFNLISIAFAVLFIGLGVDFGIHLVLRHQEALAEATGEGAFAMAGRSVGPAIALCALTSAIAFFSFLPTSYIGLAQLGAIAGAGMFIAAAVSLTLLPALLVLLGAGRRAPAAPALELSARIERRVRRRPRTVLALCLGLGLVAVAGLTRVRFDFDPLNLKNPSGEAMTAMRELWAASGRSPHSADVLAADLPSARRLEVDLRALPSVGSVESIDSFVPAHQAEKLDLVETLDLLLGPILEGEPGERTETAQGRTTALARLRRALQRLAASGEAAVAAEARRLDRALARVRPERLASLEHVLMASLPGRLIELRDGLDASPVEAVDLPPEIRHRYVSDSGQVRLLVEPKGDVRRRDALVEFVREVRSVAPRATGSPVVILEAGRAVVDAFVQATLIAIAGTALVMGFALRRVTDVLVVFAPVVLAGLWAFGFAGAADLPFNFANVIVLPLLFGLSMDFSYHVVLRDRETRAEGRSVGDTSTPRAVLMSALTTVGSFATIVLSAHPGTASMGLLLSIAIGFSLLACLVFLPALLELAGRAPRG